MSLARWEERLAPFDGIVAVAFWFAGVLILQGPADQPDQDASPARALLFFKQEDSAILLGTFLFMVGTLFFLWFLGLVRKQLFSHESAGHRLTGSLTPAVSRLPSRSSDARRARGRGDQQREPDARRGAGLPGDQRRVLLRGELSAAVFLLALGLVSLATQAFPRWLAWCSLLLTVWLVIPPIGWAALLWGFPLWLIAISLLLATRSRSDSRRDPSIEHPEAGHRLADLGHLDACGGEPLALGVGVGDLEGRIRCFRARVERERARAGAKRRPVRRSRTQVGPRTSR